MILWSFPSQANSKLFSETATYRKILTVFLLPSSTIITYLLSVYLYAYGVQSFWAIVLRCELVNEFFLLHKPTDPSQPPDSKYG